MIKKILRLPVSIFATFAALVMCACSSIKSNMHDNPDFKNLLDSVVKIDVWELSQKDGGSKVDRSIGSGVIMTENGMILTNAHVANMYATKIVVTLSNLERVKADFIGWDHWTDLAVIKLDTDDLKKRNLSFTYAKFGNSNALENGEVTYAVGTPHGFTRTLTRGIISNANRFFEGRTYRGYETGTFNTWIQTDAAINPGNSGGPLVLPNGDVIGINTRAYAGANNLGFAVPSSVAKEVMEGLIANGSIKRAYIGITPAPLQDMEQFFDIGINRGMLVQNVDALSPAAVAGILPGDIILSINSQSVDGRFPEQLPAIMRKISDMKVGSEITLDIMRDKKTFTKKVKCESLESRVGKEYTLEKWGVGMQEMTRALAREAKIDIKSKLLVIGIRDGYPFDIADIRGGDIIISVNRKSVSSPEELEAAYEEYVKNPKKILIEVMRERTISFHIITPPEK